MKKIISILFLLSIPFVSWGAYLENVPHQLIQPNGEVLDVFITGDEFFRRVHNSEGYSIVEGKDGWYYYALYDPIADELIPSEYVVTATRNIALPMPKGLGISHEKYMEKRRVFYEHTCLDISGAAENSILKDLAEKNPKATSQMNNVIICIGFSDTQGMSHNFPTLNGMYNENPNNNVRDYFSTVSYEKLDILSHVFPPADGSVLRYYQDSHPRNYFLKETPGNSEGYSGDAQRTQREHTLLRDAINWVFSNYPIPIDLNMDINNDGLCDYITFIVQGQVAEWSDLLWPHMSALSSYDIRLNGKRVWNYNFELDGSNSYFNAGVFCHEGFHVLGSPDLYHYNDLYAGINAVGPWDLMDQTAAKPQSMSAYMKYKYGHWIPVLPVAAMNRTYELFPFHINDGADPDKPVIYHIPMTNNDVQYSLIEYRKKTGTNYDSNLPNEGLMIYRINSGSNGNAGFNGGTVDEVFLYRPGSSQTGGIYTQGNLSQAPFNEENGRTEFNSTTDPKPCQSHGAVEKNQNINHIHYHECTDSYTFFYGDPANMTMKLNKYQLTIGKQLGTTGTVTILTNLLWQILIPEEATWLTVSKTTGINSNKVIFSALSENNTGVHRSAIVSFIGYEEILTLFIVQDTMDAGCNAEISDLEVDINLDTRLATLSWMPAQETQKESSTKTILWDNTSGETSTTYQSTRWLDGDARIVLADDFNVPEGVRWTIDEISFNGKPKGSSPFPNSIGIAVYKDNGKNRPQNTPIFEKSDFIPIEGVTSGKMHISLDQPLVFMDAGKYWISIYGVFQGDYSSSKRFDLVSTSATMEAKMCMWDPTGVSGYPHYTPDWNELMASSLSYGFSFALSGTEDYPDRTLYNIYLDGELIAEEVEKTPFLYPNQITTSEDHLWCVATLCTSYIEGDKICAHTKKVLYNINVSSNLSIGGSVAGSGIYSHGDIVTITATPKAGYIFVSWMSGDSIFSTDEIYKFKAIENLDLVAQFRKAHYLPFDSYAVTKWNNTFMLNLKKLREENFDIASCAWYKNGAYIGDGFTYSAGDQSTDLLESGALYTFELTTAKLDTFVSTPKVLNIILPDLMVYPNPTTGEFTVFCEDIAIQNIEIFDLFGRKASFDSQIISSSHHLINVSQLPAGIYILRVNNKKEVKIIIY